MSRTLLAVIAVLALGVVGVPLRAQGPHTDTKPVFNGTSLAGWESQGAAEWRVTSGEIVGTAAGGAGNLVYGTSHTDLIFRFAFQCAGCDAGVLVRNAPSSSSMPGTTQGLYVALSGPNAMTLSRLTLGADGNEMKREQLYEWTNRRNPPGMQLRVVDGPDGWKHVRVQVRGGSSVGGGVPEGAEATFGTFAPVALRVRSGEARFRDLLLTDLLHPAMGVASEVTAANFRRIQLTDRFYSEGISAGDINNDGVMDALSGPYAYLGPDFVRGIEIYAPQTYAIANETMAGRYTDNFLNYVHDFTGDGWNDYLKINFNGAYLYVNPQGESRYWEMHQVSEGGVSSETTQLGDIDGDGDPDLLMSAGSGADRVVGFLKPGADATEQWTFHAVSEAGDWGGHGYGYGDLNGDGKVDVLQGSGWWEQPATGVASGPWKFHAVPFGRGTDPFVRGADMFAYDVNGDDLPDVVTSLFAHGPGLVWFEQQRSAQGAISWNQHMIMDSPDTALEEREEWEITDKSVVFTELHAIELVDMDNDGLKDIVTGKRWFSHGMEYPENDIDDPAVVAWLKLVRKADGQVEFVPQIINNRAGVGTQIKVADMNDDGRPDVLTAQRKGVYIFLNDVYLD